MNKRRCSRGFELNDNTSSGLPGGTISLMTGQCHALLPTLSLQLTITFGATAGFRIKSLLSSFVRWRPDLPQDAIATVAAWAGKALFWRKLAHHISHGKEGHQDSRELEPR